MCISQYVLINLSDNKFNFCYVQDPDMKSDIEKPVGCYEGLCEVENEPFECVIVKVSFTTTKLTFCVECDKKLKTAWKAIRSGS